MAGRSSSRRKWATAWVTPCLATAAAEFLPGRVRTSIAGVQTGRALYRCRRASRVRRVSSGSTSVVDTTMEGKTFLTGDAQGV
jgi:hypothetical protein